jgi:GTPase SAR1 family protein
MNDAELQAQQIELSLRKERLENLFKFKVLLLGAGESGKSTIVKQIKLCHNKGPSGKELEAVADSLHQNVIDCMKTLLYACTTFGYELDDDKDRETAERVKNFDEGKRIEFDFGEDILKLWQSETIKKTYARNDEYWLLDSCKYYFTNLERFTEFEFCPTAEDAVMARIRTTGIVVSQIEEQNPDVQKYQGEPDVIKYQIVDVGGQRNERKKWLHCFEDVKCILFLCSLSEYNQVLFEDSKANRMDESLKLLGDIAKKPIFLHTPMYIFLNKKDVFETMLRSHPLSVKFPEYKGGESTGVAIEFIKNKFIEQLPQTRRDSIMCFPVTGVVRKDVGTAFAEVKKDLLRHARPKIEEEKLRIERERKEEEGSQCVIL